MTSDKERREVAARLRETCDEIERTGNGLTVWELTDILAIRDDDSGMIEGLNLDDARNLADIIECPTCRDLVEHKPDPFVPGKRMTDGVFRCSSCGWYGRIYEYIGFGDMLAYEAVFCPKCGKEIER